MQQSDKGKDWFMADGCLTKENVTVILAMKQAGEVR
jgi:hypothetical protein